MKRMPCLVLLLSLLGFMGCSKMLFKKPLPVGGDIVRTLPDFLTGSYRLIDGTEYLEVERISEQQCVVKSYTGFTSDSLQALVEVLNTDSTSAELRGTTLIVKEPDTTRTEVFTEADGYYYTEKRPKYEIHLGEGYFIDDFKTLEEQKAILKEWEDTYYLNVVEGEHWFLIVMRQTDDGMIIRNTTIADTAFKKNLTYYRGITDIEELSSSSYLADPADKELRYLLEEPHLFVRQEWERVGGGLEVFLDGFNWLYVAGIGLLLILVGLGIGRIRKGRIKQI